MTHVRRGLTLVEVLVALAVIGLLVGLTVPAIQRARSAAAAASCRNNLRQLALGLHAHHTDRGAFPHAYHGYWNFCEPAEDPSSVNDRPRKSWAALILPYLEQQAVADMGAEAAAGTVVQSFGCAADPRVRLPSLGGHYKAIGSAFGLTSYLAVEGSAYRRGPSDTNLSLEFGGPTDGVVHRGPPTKLTDVIDGTSSTLLLGERPPSPSPDLMWGWWAWSAYDSALAVTEERSFITIGCPKPVGYSPGAYNDPCAVHHFWSPHPGDGGHWAFADGSVRFLSYHAADIVPALATRNGGESVDASQY